MEKIRKRDIWYDREIRQMLSIINDKHIKGLIHGKAKRNKRIFLEIARDLKKKEIMKTDVQIRNKYKSLKSDFCRAKRSNNKSGARRQTCEHFELLDQLFGNCPALQSEGVDVIEMDSEDTESIINGTDNITSITEEKHPLITSQDEESSATTSNFRSFKWTKNNSYQKAVETVTKESKELQQDLLKPMQEQKLRWIPKTLNSVIIGPDDDIIPITEEKNPLNSSQDEESAAIPSNLRRLKRTKKNSYQKVVETFTKDWKESQQELLKTMQKQEEKMVDLQIKKQQEMLDKSLKAMEKILEKDRLETAKMLEHFLNAVQPAETTGPYILETPPCYFREPSSPNITLLQVTKTSPENSP